MEDLLLFNRNKFFLGEHKVITLKQQFLGIILCFFMYIFKKAVAIVFLCENAVEAIHISSISMILNLNCSYSIFTKKRNSHGHFKHIKNIKLYLGIVVSVLSLCVHPKKVYFY